MADQLNVPAGRLTIDCPNSVEWTAGNEFRCTAEDGRGNQRTVTVFMQNGDGEYYWEVN